MDHLIGELFIYIKKVEKKIIEADALSRIPERISVDTESVKAIANSVMLNDFTELNENPNLFICKSVLSQHQNSFPTNSGLKKQKEDLVISQLLQVRKF